MRFFVDLDHTLLQTPYLKTIGLHNSQLPYAVKFTHTFDGDFISVLRKDAHFFLEELNKRGETYLLTASQPNYYEHLLKHFDLRKYFKECYSVHRDLGEVNPLLRGSSTPVEDYIMIDDLDRQESYCIHRKRELIDGKQSSGFEPKHFLQVKDFNHRSRITAEWLRHRGLPLLDELIALREYPNLMELRTQEYLRLEQDFEKETRTDASANVIRLWEGQVPWEIIILDTETFIE